VLDWTPAWQQVPPRAQTAWEQGPAVHVTFYIDMQGKSTTQSSNTVECLTQTESNHKVATGEGMMEEIRCASCFHLESFQSKCAGWRLSSCIHTVVNDVRCAISVSLCAYIRGFVFYSWHAFVLTSTTKAYYGAPWRWRQWDRKPKTSLVGEECVNGFLSVRIRKESSCTRLACLQEMK
jgi:hypothetical protein